MFKDSLDPNKNYETYREYWRNPKGVEVDFDELSFLYVTDQAQHMMMGEIAKQFFSYQDIHQPQESHITKIAMVTMGGLLPGVLLSDYISHFQKNHIGVEFGSIGVKYYEGVGQPLAEPKELFPLTCNVESNHVAILDDLIDLGGTTRFIKSLLVNKYQAGKVSVIAPYIKGDHQLDMDVMSFGQVPKDTWIITPRERFETLVDRTLTWHNQGVGLNDIYDTFLKIGYEKYFLDEWFELILK